LGKYGHQFTQEYFMPSFAQFAEPCSSALFTRESAKNAFSCKWEEKNDTCIEIRIRHLTSNMLIGFYMMG
jgi:hypothetical protein